MTQNKKNTILWISLILNILFIFIIAIWIYKIKIKFIPNKNTNYKNTTFISDLYGTTTLENGKSISKDTELGESGIVETGILEGEKLNVKADIDEDGKQDDLFFIFQNGGGSGTFIYLLAKLSSNEKNKLVQAYLIGDRISPQGISINKDGNIQVAFLDRLDEEPFSEEPTLLKRIILKFNKNTYTFEKVDAPKDEVNIY